MDIEKIVELQKKFNLDIEKLRLAILELEINHSKIILEIFNEK